MITQKEKTLIENLTKDIIETAKINILKDDIETIIEKLNGDIIETKNITDEIGVKRCNDKFIIILPPMLTPIRKRFRIAQELGHLFLHMGYMTDIDTWNKQSKSHCYTTNNIMKIYQTNEFAMAFLMPAFLYKDIMDAYTNDNIVYTSEIAKTFQVSTSLAAKRGKELGYLKLDATDI